MSEIDDFINKTKGLDGLLSIKEQVRRCVANFKKAGYDMEEATSLLTGIFATSGCLMGVLPFALLQIRRIYGEKKDGTTST